MSTVVAVLTARTLQSGRSPGNYLERARFLHSFDETIDDGLILPRGLMNTVAALAQEAGSNLEVTDERSAGNEQSFTFTGTLTRCMTPPPASCCCSAAVQAPVTSNPVRRVLIPPLTLPLNG